MPNIGDTLCFGTKKVKKIWVACEDCGQERWVRIAQGKPRNKICHHCASLRGAKTPKPWMFGERNHQWKGGRYKNSKGYVMTRVTRDSFFWNMTHKNKHKGGQGVIPEHRLVMAKHLNRCLLPWEVIHHKNGIKDDNRIENLELLPTSKFHLVDTEAKATIKRLENENKKLRELLKFLDKNELGIEV